MSDQQQPGAGRAILDRIALLETRLASMEQRILTAIGGASHAPAPGVASDADLDSEWGNPEVKKNPPRWQGGDFAGKRYSECTPEFLDEMASFHDWRVGKAEDEKKAGYARKDAARARGWAARLRAKPAEAPPQDPPADPNW